VTVGASAIQDFCLVRDDGHFHRRLVQHDALEWIAFVFSRPAFKRAPGIAVSSFPPHADPRCAEIDILGVTLVVNARRQQSHNIHAGEASIAGEIAYLFNVAIPLRNFLDQRGDDVTQAMDLTLASNVTRNPARILNVLLAMEDIAYGIDRERV